MAKPNGRHHEQHGPQIVLPNGQSEVATESTQERETAAAVEREVDFTILPDGRIVDLIRSNRQSPTLSFLVWQDGSIQLASHIEHEGELLVPPQMDPTVLSALRLPMMVGNCSDVDELFTVIVNQIEKFVDIPADHSFLCAAFAVSTWFADQLLFAPLMSICGPMGSGKTTLQRLLHCFCRRAIHCSAITPASLYRLTAQIRPTMIIDEVECAGDRASRELKRLLRGGNRQGAPVLCGGKAFDNFGPKVITSRIPFDDAALASRTISIAMSPSERDVPRLDLDAEQELANTLQPMLQNFRLSHYAKVAASSNPRFLKFPPRLRDTARTLAAGMFGNEKLEQHLAGALESQMQSMQFDRFSEPEWVVMLALFGVYHDAKCNLFVQGVTHQVNEILHENGARQSFSPRMVGSILKSLGFPTRRQGRGYHVELTAAVGRRLHSLAKNMGITYADIMPSINVKSGIVNISCDLCSEFGLMTDHENRRLLTVDEMLRMPCILCGTRSEERKCPSCGTVRSYDG